MGLDLAELRTVDLFAGLTPAEVEAVSAVGTLHSYKPGDLILRKGEQTTDLYVVLQGQVEVVTELVEGKSSLVILGEGQSFGEMSLLDAGPRSATIRCISPGARLLLFRREALLNFGKGECEIGYKLMYNIARDLAFKLRIRNITCNLPEQEGRV